MQKQRTTLSRAFAIGLLSIFGWGIPQTSQALELDWSGQFWSEFNFIYNYTLGNNGQTKGDPYVTGGYTYPGGGPSANFGTLFMRLRPKVIVNDNIYIKSEFWVSDPVFGVFGNALPYSFDQRQFYSTSSRGSFISAQRFWGEFVTDLGTVQLGRVPLDWGLGVVWNSGDRLWDRYMSTGDGIRWIAKFGSFSFIPSLLVNTLGNSLGGGCTVQVNNGLQMCVPTGDSGSIVDYSVIFKYENPEEELEGGVNIIKRLGGFGQDTSPGGGVLVPGANPEAVGGINITTFDFYARKRFNQLMLRAEVPIVSGSLGGVGYSSLGVAGEVDWKPTDILDLLLKVGYAPGQASGSSSMGTFNAFYFNPNYHIGMIMFNYQLANFSGPQTLNNPNLSPSGLRSPYDNPIVDAIYAAVSAQIKPWEKWTLQPALLLATAPQTAGGSYFYNNWTRAWVQSAGGGQSNFLGAEVDFGATYHWDESFQLGLGMGLFFPGPFYAFSNSAAGGNATNPVFATTAKVGIVF